MLRAILVASLLMTAPALAGGSCFSIREFHGWRAPDAKTIYIRVAQTRYFRLDLGASCSQLTFPGAHLITETRGPDLMCSGIDWDLAVSTGTPGSIPMHCIVKQQTELTPDEVAAIPKQFKPN
ncbi:MAG TPA: hypothetical protein VG889_13180 [Rhizomicrobium sp.]|nr:hypothetical protein [Rhizomicrobium sp.]